MSTTEILGQYASDYGIHAGHPALDADPSNQKALRGDGAIGFHLPAVLFDEAPTVPDEATGEVPITLAADEAEILALEGVTVITDLRKGKPKVMDAAEKWLKDNDPDYKKHKV